MSIDIEELREHVEAGDRIAYYEALEAMGDPYGALANVFLMRAALAEGIEISAGHLAGDRPC